MDHSIHSEHVVRFGGILATTWLLYSAYYIWAMGGDFVHPVASLLSVLLYGVFFVCGFLTFGKSLPGWYPMFIIAGLAIGVAAHVFTFLHIVNPGVESDGSALSLAAAQEVLRGQNPYAADISHAFTTFHVPKEFNTPRVDGSVVSTVPYPALSFLLYLPAVAFGIDPQALSVAAFIVAMLLLYFSAPPPLKTLAPLVFFLDPSYISYLVGVQDILYVPAMMIAAFLWTDLPVVAGVCLGIACAIKQEPWVMAPFFLLGVLVGTSGELRRRATLTTKAAIAAIVAFAIPNLPFALTAPQQWFASSFDPFTGRMVQWGSGLYNLVFGGFVTIPRAGLTAISMSILLTLLVVAYLRFAYVRNALWLAPGLMLFAAPRSLENYFLYLVPLCLASWFGEQSEAREWKVQLLKAWQAKSMAVGATALTLMLLGCSSAADVQVRVLRTADSSGSGYVDRLVVSVHNGSSSTIRPTYLVVVGVRQFVWPCVSGCGDIRANATRLVTIQSQDYASSLLSDVNAAVIVVNARSGQEDASPPFLAHASDVHVLNPRLRIPDDQGYTIPAGWSVNLADVANGVAVYHTNGLDGRISLTLKSSGREDLRKEAISTPFVPFDHGVFALVSKDVLYEGGAMPVRYAGVAITDDEGESITYCWGNVSTMRVYASDRVYVVEPVSWPNDRLLIDTRTFRTFVHPRPDASYRLWFVIGARASQRDLKSTFSGLLVNDKDNRNGGSDRLNFDAESVH